MVRPGISTENRRCARQEWTGPLSSYRGTTHALGEVVTGGKQEESLPLVVIAERFLFHRDFVRRQQRVGPCEHAINCRANYRMAAFKRLAPCETPEVEEGSGASGGALAQGLSYKTKKVRSRHRTGRRGISVAPQICMVISLAGKVVNLIIVIPLSGVSVFKWRVFTTCPRQADAAACLFRFRRTLALTHAAGFSGTLIYTGNEVPMEPWLAAAEMARDHPSLSPFVAVNPIYMHPFTVARCISSLASAYGVRCDLNLIAGTSLSDLAALDEFDAHDDRYMRLREFAVIVRDLCAGRGSVSFDGRYFGVRGLVLPSRIPDALQPGFVVAGQSAAADETAKAVGAESLGGLQPDFRPHTPRARGVYMSVLCRATEDQAQAALAARYPDDLVLPSPARHGRNTDAVWKSAFAGMGNAAAQEVGPYRLGPFRRGQLDCPLLVGSTLMVRDAIVWLAEGGIERFVLDLPDAEVDYMAVADAFAQAAQVMATRGAE